MSPKLGNLLIVLAAAAVVCATVVGLDRRSSLGPIGPRESEQPPGSSPQFSTDSQMEESDHRPPTQRPGGEPHERVNSASEVEEFHDWLGRYLASARDLKQLRRELEETLARLPAADGETEAAGEIATIEALRRAELKPGVDFRSLMDSAEQFIERYPHSSLADEAKSLFEKYARAWDEHEFQSARDFAKANSHSFDGQLARFQTYIEQHGSAGKFVAESHAAMARIRAEWAEHDYRQIYDFANRYPIDLAAVAPRVRRFLNEHPASLRRAAAEAFVARYEQAATPREYRIRVKSGSFERSVARTLSRGPDLAVEIEVAGVRVGRTPIVADSFEPTWDYEFPQSVRWRLGDAVRIRVIDFDYGNRTILKIEPAADDPLALRFLTGPITAEGHQLVFESDFQVPTLAAP